MSNTHEDFSRDQPVKSSTNRAFGWVFVFVFLIIAFEPLVVGRSFRPWPLIASGLVMLVTVMAPALLTIPNRLWLRLGMLLHRIVSPVALAIMFFLLVTPMGLLARLFARKAVRRGRDVDAVSYWIKRDPPGPRPESMSNQF